MESHSSKWKGVADWCAREKLERYEAIVLPIFVCVPVARIVVRSSFSAAWLTTMFFVFDLALSELCSVVAETLFAPWLVIESVSGEGDPAGERGVDLPDAHSRHQTALSLLSLSGSARLNP